MDNPHRAMTNARINGSISIPITNNALPSPLTHPREMRAYTHTQKKVTFRIFRCESISTTDFSLIYFYLSPFLSAYFFIFLFYIKLSIFFSTSVFYIYLFVPFLSFISFIHKWKWNFPIGRSIIISKMGGKLHFDTSIGSLVRPLCL